MSVQDYMDCLFCSKSKDECDLSDTKGLELVIDGEIFNFNEIIGELFGVKVCLHLTTLIITRISEIFGHFRSIKSKL